MYKEIKLDISGLGIIIYSDFAVKHIKEDEDYFSSHYESDRQVLKHVYKGSIVGFCTSSPGSYTLKIKDGYPDENEIELYEFTMRLGIQVKGGRVYFRDLYDLMEWTHQCQEDQIMDLSDGFYHITLCTNIPETGVIGDNQIINIYFNKLDKMPKLKFDGVPTLCY